jgi:hypothetical protein
MDYIYLKVSYWALCFIYRILPEYSDYIEYYGNIQMCEICLVDIFYTWGEIVSILLWGIREWFNNHLMRYCHKGLWLMPISHPLVVQIIIMDTLLYYDRSRTLYKYRSICWLSFYGEIQNDNMRIYFLKPTNVANFWRYHMDYIT